MKEQIRTPRKFRKFNITMKTKEGVILGKWQGDANALIHETETILQEYTQQGITMTLRQLYYQLVARGVIPNNIAVYKKISCLLTDARYAGFLDWDMLDDLTRESDRMSEWSDLSSLLDSALYSYRKPRWQGQEYHVELLTEKEALYSVLKPIADKWHVYLSVNRGFGSATLAYNLSGRVQEYIERGKHVVFLYIGDHDPSGLDMIRDVRERITEILQHRQVQVNRFQLKHIALTFAQIQEFRLPENPAKKTDTRFKAYKVKYGDVSWEVDALRPDVMTEIVETEICRYLDLSLFNAIVDEEKQEKATLREFVNRFEGGEL